MHLVDGVRHLLRRCREQDVLAQPRRAWSVTMAQSAVAGGMFTSWRQQRERGRELLLLLASLLPLVASHADYFQFADHGWCASTSDVVCRHFTAPVKHTSRRMLWLWIWCRECSRHCFARLLFTALRPIDASPLESFTAAPCVVLCQHKTLLLCVAWLTVQHHCVGTCKDVDCRSRCWAPLFGCGSHTSGCIVAHSNA
ncbi:hypothetical protein Tc00.1047053511793.20 [Trypanosoma cruzi]|uniref:Uncharacterized protein n=1 Tax=Trypanosoma cruzi (strain CL Brener) TaxID=353153 RepID=Q4CNA1_TRYCC|nr:hypothetical protein Tc00.1047053511793.20 [Trypanosoma cruzi]EAN81753.1 hypothetical protein Tc00.1047053511793.20 [Trypanosoma cruzi]|eukprot:XP_803199.1 hypothetical protein [Trypanosoma cruzi strain CL Brener]